MTGPVSSLRGRLVLTAIAVGVVFAVLFGAVATWRIHHTEDQAIRSGLQSRMELARDQVTRSGVVRSDTTGPTTDLVQVVGPDGRVRSSSAALAGVAVLADVQQVRSSHAGVRGSIALQAPDIDLATLAVPVHLSSASGSPGGTGALVVALNREGYGAASTDLLRLLIGGLAAVVVAMAVLSWALTGRALRSVTRLTEDAEAVQPRDLGDGLPVPRGDAELARLVGALNRMLARLRDSHTAELAFAADAGHRLRTPVATLRAEAELALRDEDSAVRTEALERIVGDADQLTSIVDRMLARSRAGPRHPAPVLATLREALPRWQRQAGMGSVTLTMQIDERLPEQSRCAELVEIVDPVLDNAVRHTPPSGSISVEVRCDPAAPGSVRVDVTNTGSTVPPQLAPHIFDAWVSSRGGSAAGGLGLWLARETARDVGGELTLEPTGPQGTRFRLRLPVEKLPGV